MDSSKPQQYNIEEHLSALYGETPLDASRRQIRLIKLHAGEWDRPICCHLSSASLGSKPNYQALSYTWGTDSETRNIIINDRPFPVRKNLYKILKRLRRHVVGEDLVLWIDAICINQSKLAMEERAAQVKMMTTIYSSCRQVLVWLGDCYTKADPPRCLRFLTRGRDNKELLQEYANDFRRDATELDYCFHLACFFFLLKDTGREVNYNHYELPPFWGTGLKDTMSRLSRYGIPPTTEEFKECYTERMCLMLRYVSESAWTTRIWTVQEFATAPKVTICFGTTAVPLESFYKGFKVYDYGGDAHRGHALWALRFSNRLGMLQYAFHRHILLRNAMTTIWPWARLNSYLKNSYLNPLLSRVRPSSLWILRRMARKSSTTIFEMVASFRDSEASNALDKVFAVMSFMSFVGIPLPIEINYAVSVEDLYTSVSSNQILTCKNNPEAYEPLAPLRFCREKNRYKTLPSWVVDWTSYPWNDDHIISEVTRAHRLSPDMVPWLQIEPNPDEDQDGRTLESPTRMIGATKYNAAEGIEGYPPSIFTASNFTILALSGISIGTVCEVISLDQYLARRLAGMHESISKKKGRGGMVLRTLTADMLDKAVDWGRIDEFWASLLAALEVAQRGLVEEMSNGTKLGLISLQDVAMRAEKLTIIRYADPEERAKRNIDAAFVEQLGELMRWIGLMSKGNSLFITDTGYVGLGGNGMSAEDRVYILHQGRTPFVLRRSGSRFRVISECYVDGLMTGEAASLGLKPERIEIE